MFTNGCWASPTRLATARCSTMTATPTESKCFQQKKIKNIINNNSITIISHFDIEENSIKKNSDINYNNNDNNIENKDLNDSADKDITNYICEDEEKDKEKKEIIQKKLMN